MEFFIIAVAVIVGIPIVMSMMGYKRPTGDFDKGLEAYNTGDYKTARMEFSWLAEQAGDTDAMLYVGLMYENGYDYPQNYKRALKWYRRAAEQGHAEAQFIVGRMYNSGRGIQKDYLQEMKWYSLAAEQGHLDAQTHLGVMYGAGMGIPKDNIQALVWYNIAALKGFKPAIKLKSLIIPLMTSEQKTTADRLAQEWIARNNQEHATVTPSAPAPTGNLDKAFDAYEKGDYATALYECQPLAEQGNAVAQNNLGTLYHKGLGVSQDYNRAFKWYSLAAEQGNADAQTSLGGMYFNANGVPQDYSQAFKWCSLAAVQGHAEAQFHIGWMYSEGKGVLQNDQEARKWYELSAKQGHLRALHNLRIM